MLKNAWMQFKRRILPYAAAYTAKGLIRALLFTCKIKVQGIDDLIKTAQSGPCILALWHNRLIIISEILNKHAPQFIYTAFISKSRDGDALAKFAESYKAGRALRVAHNGRHFALGNMITKLKENNRNIMMITPDGPRGPRYTVKPGIILAAKESQAKIIPFTWESDKFWQLKTWDQMRIPKPFSTIHVTFGSPISPNELQGESFEDGASLVKEALNPFCS